MSVGALTRSRLPETLASWKTAAPIRHAKVVAEAVNEPGSDPKAAATQAMRMGLAASPWRVPLVLNQCVIHPPPPPKQQCPKWYNLARIYVITPNAETVTTWENYPNIRIGME